MARRESIVTRIARIAAPLAVAMLLAACGGTNAPARQAVDVQPDDTCAVCGMELSHSPGPRAQAWVAARARPLMFDSTRDFFAYILQPENQADLQDLFVQDTQRIDWQQPGRDAASFIDARQAVYVAWQPLPGSMGPTLAPFANRAEAAAFVREHGGAALAFNQVTLPLITNLPSHCPAPQVAADGSAIPCRVTRSPSPTGEPPGARGDTGTH